MVTNKIFILWLLITGCAACSPDETPVNIPRSTIAGDQVTLETSFGGHLIRLQGSQMTASPEFTQIELRNGAAIQLDSTGSITCDTLQILNEGNSISCTGQVRAHLMLPDNWRREPE